MKEKNDKNKLLVTLNEKNKNLIVKNRKGGN